MQHMAAEEQSDKMASDMEVNMEQMCVIELLHVEKKLLSLTLIDICWMFMETRQWMVVVFQQQTVQIFTSMACSFLFIVGENA